MATLQGKLTFLGLSLHGGAPSILFGGPRAFPSVDVFSPYYDPRVFYEDDAGPSPIRFAATAAELDAMLDSIATVPAVIDRS